MIVRRVTATLFVCAAACGRPVISTSSPDRPVIVLADVSVIDGTGGPALKHQTIVLRDGKIAELFTTGSRVAPRGARTLQLSGHTVIPGLMDSHVHATLPFTTTARQDSILGFMFRGGITAVRDMAGDAVVLLERKRAASQPNVEFPRIYFSALMAGPSWISVDNRARPIAHGEEPGRAAWLREVTPESDLPAVIRDAKSIGATGIKIYADLPGTLVAALTAEAHRQGVRVWSHAAIIPARPSEAVAAGVEVLSHVMSIVLEGVDTMPSREGLSARFHDYEAVPANAPSLLKLIASMRARGTILEPTLFATTRRSERASRDSTQRRFVPLAAWAYSFTRSAHSAGVPILAGTDLMGEPGTDSLPFLHSELELLVSKVGMTPVEAIHGATGLAAGVVGAADSLGTISVGKIADLVVLRANPVDDIRNTRSVLYVIKGGVIHDRMRR